MALGHQLRVHNQIHKQEETERAHWELTGAFNARFGASLAFLLSESYCKVFLQAEVAI